MVVLVRGGEQSPRDYQRPFEPVATERNGRADGWVDRVHTTAVQRANGEHAFIDNQRRTIVDTAPTCVTPTPRSRAESVASVASQLFHKMDSIAALLNVPNGTAKND